MERPVYPNVDIHFKTDHVRGLPMYRTADIKDDQIKIG